MVTPRPLPSPSKRLLDLNPRAMQAFAEVMRLGSATAAARQLGATQSTVSRLIGQMEQTLGFEVFYREKGRLIATGEGMRLLAEVELALASMERLGNLARDLAGFSSGTIRIVAPPSFSEAVLADIVALFIQDHPAVEFNIDSRSPETARSMIAMRYADCGFVKLPVDASDLAADAIVANGSVCVMRHDHPLAAHDVITPVHIGRQPMILLGAGRRWRSQVDEAFAAFDLRPVVGIETHTHGSACALADKCNGVAILNELLATPYLRPPLVARRFEPAILHQYAFAVSSLSPPSRLVQEFRKVVLNWFRNPAADMVSARRDPAPVPLSEAIGDAEAEDHVRAVVGQADPHGGDQRH